MKVCAIPVKLINTFFKASHYIVYQSVVPDFQFSVVYENIYKHISNQFAGHSRWMHSFCLVVIIEVIRLHTVKWQLVITSSKNRQQLIWQMKDVKVISGLRNAVLVSTCSQSSQDKIDTKSCNLHRLIANLPCCNDALKHARPAFKIHYRVLFYFGRQRVFSCKKRNRRMSKQLLYDRTVISVWWVAFSLG